MLQTYHIELIHECGLFISVQKDFREQAKKDQYIDHVVRIQ
jgi:hypothetical protein